MTEKVRNYYTGRQEEAKRRNRIDPENPRREKELRTKRSCFREGVLCLVRNQRQYFEDQQLCSRNGKRI